MSAGAKAPATAERAMSLSLNINASVLSYNLHEIILSELVSEFPEKTRGGQVIDIVDIYTLIGRRHALSKQDIRAVLSDLSNFSSKIIHTPRGLTIKI